MSAAIGDERVRDQLATLGLDLAARCERRIATN